MQYEIKEYDDEQVTAVIGTGSELRVTIRGNSYSSLFQAASIKEAWDSDVRNKGKATYLKILCLIGQRSDRRFHANESFDLKVIANFINSMGYDRVGIFHPHSDVALALINNSYRITPFGYIQNTYRTLQHPILVSPDAGAYKYLYSIANEMNAELIAANKVRVGGEPIITVEGDIAGKDCLIVDDIADGGRTFHYLAEQLKLNKARNVYLYVTHGMFHYGFEMLEQYIDGIYCTNSYQNIEHRLVTQYEVIQNDIYT